MVLQSVVYLLKKHIFVNNYLTGKLLKCNVNGDISSKKTRRGIKVPVSIYGIRYIIANDQFVAARGTSIVWLNATDGQKIKETKTNGNTFYICAHDSTSYVCADELNNLSSSTNGSIKFSYQNQEWSSHKGIYFNFLGSFFVCSRESNNIYQITQSGELIRKIAFTDLGTMDSWVIRFKQNTNIFLVTSVTSEKVVIAEII